MRKAILTAAATTLLCLTGAPVCAQGQTPTDEQSAERPWYYGSEGAAPDPKTIHMQKAQRRGEQRAARMAAMEWYGMSNARPRAAATPFTSLYSPVWQMPGGRPFAWYPRSQVVYLYR